MEPDHKKDRIMPTIYIPHGGGPCFFMDWDPKDTWNGMASWLSGVSATLPRKPRAILVISAHWEEAQPTINSCARPNLLFDYYGFPPHTYELTYPVSGAPELAEQTAELFSSATSGMEISINDKRGLDHGVFIPLKVMFPEADIPVLQISLKAGLDAAEHIAIGRVLAPLRRQDVLILGSGMSYHNLSRFGNGRGRKEAQDFDDWLNNICSLEGQERSTKLSRWESAPSARLAHPREEHLIPLMVTCGAAENDKAKRVYHELVMGLAISAFQFG